MTCAELQSMPLRDLLIHLRSQVGTAMMIEDQKLLRDKTVPIPKSPLHLADIGDFSIYARFPDAKPSSTPTP